MKKCIILANGNPPAKSVFNYLNKAGYTNLFCADGGAETALKYKLIPDAVIGDFDSIKPKTLKYFSSRSKIIHLKRQNDTDVEKCLKHAMKDGFTDVMLLGATGDRLDHLFCNMGIVLKFFDQIKIKFIHSSSILTAYETNVVLETIPGETISIYGFDEKTKITSKGLKYPLKNVALPFGKRESTSNIAFKNKIELKIKGGRIFVIRDVKIMMRHGLI